MAGLDPADGHAYIAGDGDYAIEVVGGSRHQDRLEWLAQGRGEESAQYACTAVLAPEPDNPFDPNAVSVSIRGVRVGYLSFDAAAAMTAAMQRWGFDRAVCEAIIEGGWYRSADDKGDFRVRLDANRDFATTVERDADAAAAQYVPVATAMAPPKMASNVKSVGVGALATLAMLMLIGFVWLVVQPTARSVTSHTDAAPPTEPVPESRSRRQAGLTSRDDAQEAVPYRPSSWELNGLRPVVAVTEAAKEASALPAPQPLQAVAPLARGAASIDPARGTGVLRTAAASPPPSAEEARRVLDPRRPAAALAAPLTPEVRPFVAAAIAPPALRAAAQPVPSAVQTAASPPAADGIAARNPDAAPRGGDALAARGAGDADARPAQPQEAKAQPASRKHRVNSKPRMESRAARANAKSRNAARHSWRVRRPGQVQPSASPAPPRPPPEVALPGGSMATRMLEGWTREWTSRLPPLVAPPRPVQ